MNVIGIYVNYGFDAANVKPRHLHEHYIYAPIDTLNIAGGINERASKGITYNLSNKKIIKL
jgi:hypothetical protein